MKPEIRVGMSGWTYEPWRGSFYPEGLVQKKELSYASRAVNSIEINGTFYGMQKPSSFISWANDTPDNFKFSVKAPRYLTHVKRLKDYGSALANFFATGLLRLDKKLGVILWQFPAFVALKDSRFEDFFGLLPQTSFDALEIAKNYSPKLQDIVDLNLTNNFPIHHVFEFRNESFFNPDFLKVMKKNNVGLVLADSAAKNIYSEDLTSNVVYLRMHGMAKRHEKGYSEKEINQLAEKIRKWSTGDCVDGPRILKETIQTERSVFVYFDNESKGSAPFNAMTLLKKLNLVSSDVPENRARRDR